MVSYLKSAVAALMIVLLAACSSEPESQAPAPMGELKVLEALAESYNKLSEEQLSVSPVQLSGEERKRFLSKVFADAGYNYSATLSHMAEQGIDKANPLHRDLAELVLMPHRHLRDKQDPADIYDTQELQDVAVLERALNQ